MCVTSHHSPHPSTPFSLTGIGTLLSPHTPPPCWFQTPCTYIHCYRKKPTHSRQTESERNSNTRVRSERYRFHFTEFSGFIYFNDLAGINTVEPVMPKIKEATGFHSFAGFT